MVKWYEEKVDTEKVKECLSKQSKKIEEIYAKKGMVLLSEVYDILGVEWRNSHPEFAHMGWIKDEDLLFGYRRH